jgi:hypothetical protein
MRGVTYVARSSVSAPGILPLAGQSLRTPPSPRSHHTWCRGDRLSALPCRRRDPVGGARPHFGRTAPSGRSAVDIDLIATEPASGSEAVRRGGASTRKATEHMTPTICIGGAHSDGVHGTRGRTVPPGRRSDRAAADGRRIPKRGCRGRRGARGFLHMDVDEPPLRPRGWEPSCEQLSVDLTLGAEVCVDTLMVDAHHLRQRTQGETGQTSVARQFPRCVHDLLLQRISSQLTCMRQVTCCHSWHYACPPSSGQARRGRWLRSDDTPSHGPAKGTPMIQSVEIGVPYVRVHHLDRHRARTATRRGRDRAVRSGDDRDGRCGQPTCSRPPTGSSRRRQTVSPAPCAWSVTSNTTIAALTALWGLLASITGPRTAIAIAGLLILTTPLLLPRHDRTPQHEREVKAATACEGGAGTTTDGAAPGRLCTVRGPGTV